MKKLLFLLVVAGLATFAACKSGPSKEEKAATADSLAKVDSIRKADSIASAVKTAAEAAKADSIAKLPAKK